MNTFLLALIAGSVVIMAVIQVVAVIYAARLGKRVEQLSAQIERDVRPIFSELHSLSSDAARAMSLAAAQVERADRMLNDLSNHVDQLFGMLQTKVIAPLRDGASLLAGVRAVIAAIRELSESRRGAEPSVDDEDALFIG